MNLADSGIPAPPPWVALIDPRILSGIFVTLVAAALTYCGESPMKYLGVAPQAVTYPMVGGFLLYALASPLRGRRARSSQKDSSWV